MSWTTSAASYAVDLYPAAEARSREVLGDQRLATLMEQGAALDHHAAVAYLRAEADRVLEQHGD